jgi:hypothetical protein
MKGRIENFPKVIWLFLLALFYFADGFDKFSRATEGGRVAFLFRMVAIFGMLIYIIYKPKVLFSENRYVYLLALLAIVCIGYLSSGLYSNADVMQSLYVCIRYLAFIIFLYFLLSCIRGDRENSSHVTVCKTIVFLFLFNCVIAWIGFTFKIEVLRTYGHISDLKAGWVDQRFGYDGLLLEQNNATYFYIIGFISTYWLYTQNRLSVIWLIFGFISCFIVGTKSLYVAILLMTSFIVIKKTQLRVILLASLFIFILIVLLISNSFWDKMDLQLINQLLSGRLSLFSLHIAPILDDLNITQLLFGLQGGDPKKYLIEMEVADLIVFFGLIGASLYLFIMLKEIKGIVSRNKLPMAIETICIILAIAFFAGHLFYDPVSSFYFSTLILYIGAVNNQMRKEEQG